MPPHRLLLAVSRVAYFRFPGLVDHLLSAVAPVRAALDLARARGSRIRAGLGGDARCVRCGMDARIPGVTLDAAGRCGACRLHRVAAPAERRAELDEVLARPAAGTVDAVVALSGGKDGLLTLLLAVELGQRVEALLLDPGFLLPEARAEARRFADMLSVPLTEVETDLAPIVERALASRHLVPWPCTACFDALSHALVAHALRVGAPRILLGLRYGWPPSGRAVARASDAFAVYAPAAAARDLWVVNLPFALDVDEAAERALLARHGWRDPRLAGPSSNCLLPAYLEATYAARHGHLHPFTRFVAAEVRAGALDRRAGIERMTPVPDPTGAGAAVRARLAARRAGEAAHRSDG